MDPINRLARRNPTPNNPPPKPHHADKKLTHRRLTRGHQTGRVPYGVGWVGVGGRVAHGSLLLVAGLVAAWWRPGGGLVAAWAVSFSRPSVHPTSGEP